MKLRQKSLLIVTISFFALFLLIFASANTIILNNYLELEERLAENDVQRAVNAIKMEIGFLQRILLDWSVWDDSYQFVQDGNAEYVESNLVPSTFIALHMDAILIINNEMQLVYGQGVDAKEEEIADMPDGMWEAVLEKKDWLTHKDVQSRAAGIIKLPEGPMLIASTAIVTSENTGPVMGTIIMGRLLQNDEMEHFSEASGLRLQYEEAAGQLPDDYKRALRALDKEADVFLHKVSLNELNAYTVIDDISGVPLLILKCILGRDVYRQGVESYKYFIGAIVGLGFFFSLLTWLLFHKFVISRLSLLSHELRGIVKNADHSLRAKVMGTDELSDITHDINNMLLSLELSDDEFNASIVNSLYENLAVLDTSGNIISANKIWYRFASSKDSFLKNCREPGDNMLQALNQNSGAHEYVKDIIGVLSDALKTDDYNSSLEFGDLEGGHGWFLMSITSFKGRGGGVVVSILDITHRKEVETALAKSLNESQMLLNEVHHRVKNNLHIISSFHNIQQDYTQNPEVQSILQESMNRVRAMALLHEKLYTLGSLSSINIYDYLIPVIHNLLETYEATDVTCRPRIEDISIPMDKLIPIGLIVNELFSNSLKYAFKDTGAGELIIRMSTHDDTVELVLGDNGVGIPDEVNLEEPDSFGFVIVNALVEQIDGRIRRRQGSKSIFDITIPLTKESENG